MITFEKLSFGNESAADWRAWDGDRVVALALWQREPVGTWNVHDIRKGGEPTRGCGRQRMFAVMRKMAMGE